MAKFDFKRFGLEPGAGSDAAAFADSMDKGATAAAKMSLEFSAGHKEMLKQLNIEKELLSKAKERQASIKKEADAAKKAYKDALKRQKLEEKKRGYSVITAERLAKHRKKALDASKLLSKVSKEIVEQEENLLVKVKEEKEVREKINKKMENAKKIGGLLVAGFTALVALGAEFLARQTKVREEFAGTVARANELQPILQGVTSELRSQGIDFEKSSAAAKAIYESTKGFADVTKENVGRVALISQKFGISVGDTAKIAQTMKEIGGYTMEQSTNMITFASAAAEVVGVNPKDVMADIAGSAETAAKYFGDNPKQLAKAAIEARRLGLTLDDMAGVAGGLLDINTSIEAQFEAQVLTGKNFNFDQARRLALSGDIEGATKSILSQMGSIDEFNKMDIIQKKAVAEAAGLTVTQLSTALTKQKAIKDMTSEEKAEYDKLLASMDKGNKSEAEKLLAQTESLALQEQFNASMESLKEILMKSIMPAFEAITPFVKKLFEWIGKIATFLRESKVALVLMAGAAGALATKSIIMAAANFKVAVARIFASNAAMGPIGILAAGAGVAALVAAYALMPDMESAAEGGITTGPTTAMVGDNPSGKEMIVPLERADELGFGKNEEGIIKTAEPSDNKELIAKMDELITVVKTAKPINMDGAKVGEAVYLGSIQSGAA